ncbi:hypothetical protein F511_39274 [Dorcoceras hygrometricum]|uniref:tRNA(Ile)-lysidine synthetase n=1 Tax=Dorcoceras hygrometricum TaxID=472368 RepID=A0A2Z7D3R8_9LAMI|nr:hypothetical protein F511_39274 [Dorcoceras hygrometricum]
MARGLRLPFHIQAKTTFRFPSILRISAVPQLCRAYLPGGVRIFCCQQGHPIDMSVYTDGFAKRMDMAGLKPHHRIAIAVSGGPDSMALCVLTAAWKAETLDATINKRSMYIDGVLAIVVDHGLRTESTEEAKLVYNRIMDMGIKCEVARCEWLGGRPKPGHLQEEARNKRYDILQNICVQQQIGILLVAHHEDDQPELQVELFILRLSRNSGVLGLAGMAFTSQMFPVFPDISGEALKDNGILLVRPLLEFSKEDMYNVSLHCLSVMLDTSSTYWFRKSQHGYAIIDLQTLQSTQVEDLCCAKFISLVVQFISQRHKPVRGKALKLLLHYLRTFPCKVCLTVAGCYLCPAPGSKGTKVLVCCSIMSPFPLDLKLFPTHPYEGHISFPANQTEQILKTDETYSDKFIPDNLVIPFLDANSADAVVDEAKRLGILSDSTHEIIASLQKKESENFRSKSDILSDCEVEGVESPVATASQSLSPGQVGYYMNRIILSWRVGNVIPSEVSYANEVLFQEDMGVEQCCISCIIDYEMAAYVRHMIDADWIYLSDISKPTYVGETELQNQSPSNSNKQMAGETNLCLKYAKLSAQRALVSLKSIPVAARRALPVLVSPQGLLLSIPVHHCPLYLLTLFDMWTLCWRQKQVNGD